MSAAMLPEAAWWREPSLARLLDALAGPQDMVRAVGGAVRDTLAGLPVSDVDLATRWLPQQTVERLEAAGIKAVPTGMAHGTITAVCDGKVYEVTTLRRDVATDGRHATVAFTDDWAEDAARRDFTINALYADPLTGAVTDPTGGLVDLAAHRVRFIGDAGQRIDEDHLRILRWFRFLARFGEGTPDAETLALITARARQLRSLSRERVADELTRILALADPVASVRLMQSSGVLGEILPEVGDGEVAALARLVARQGALGLPADALLRLIALLPADAALAESIAARFKLSNRVRKRIAAARGGGIDDPVRLLAYRIGCDGARDRWLLSDVADGPVADVLSQIDGWTPPTLPISGGALVAMGVTAGPDVARLLRAVEAQWLAEGFPDKARVEALARGLVERRA